MMRQTKRQTAVFYHSFAGEILDLMCCCAVEHGCPVTLQTYSTQCL